MCLFFIFEEIKINWNSGSGNSKPTIFNGGPIYVLATSCRQSDIDTGILSVHHVEVSY